MYKYLENQLKLFLDYIHHPDNELRYQAVRLYEKMFQTGMLTSKEAATTFITMQTDGNPNIVAISTIQL